MKHTSNEQQACACCACVPSWLPRGKAWPCSRHGARWLAAVRSQQQQHGGLASLLLAGHLTVLNGRHAVERAVPSVAPQQSHNARAFKHITQHGPHPHPGTHGCSRCTCSAWAGHQAAVHRRLPLDNTQRCTRSATNLNILARSHVSTSSEHKALQGNVQQSRHIYCHCKPDVPEEAQCLQDRQRHAAALSRHTPES